MSDEIKIGVILKHLMKDKKLTFKKLSQISSVPISTIKTWSAGVEPKSLSHARKVARALNVSVEYLVFGESSSHAPTMNELLTKELFSGWCKVTIEMPINEPILKKKDIIT
ncbi:MAG: helix-turn-helix domain-containing protein [Bdellovibrionales bacterium]|nr:helix-turn-helix domain-containing protein [Bdellovibrionales bacterium]